MACHIPKIIYNIFRVTSTILYSYIEKIFEIEYQRKIATQFEIKQTTAIIFHMHIYDVHPSVKAF